MSRYYLLFLFSFSFFNYCLSQEKYEFVGGVKLNDSTVVSYKIFFKEQADRVSGYSVTDLRGEHETKSNIIGEYDVKKKELSFRETGIVYTKSPISQDDFCFLNVTVKNFVFGKTKNVKTNFIGLFSDNTKCINGEIMLNAIEKVEKRLEKVVKKISNSKKIPDSIKQKVNLIKMMDSLNMNILRKNQTLSVFSKANKINLIIYDGGKEDGDKITISANGKVLVNEYEADINKKTISIDLIDEKTSVVIKANNEGSIAPNTIVVEIDDNNNYIKALSNLKKGESTQIDILKSR
ncbi:hypothetical protein [Thalassobellus sediminis]|uniref:hypothetical protein n=1 Tax=Thalassobellus sediminis TaxID=3367753 RepID=UPI0037A5ECFF